MISERLAESDLEAEAEQLRADLAEIHRRGMAYVDLEKCENVLVGDDGAPLLTDFGIARLGLDVTGTYVQDAGLTNVSTLLDGRQNGSIEGGVLSGNGTVRANNGNGTVTSSPQKAQYQQGELVTLPPHPGPGFRNARPIRWSDPIPSTTSATSAPTASHIAAIALTKEIFIAKKPLAAYLIVSAEAASVIRISESSGA